ncbi:MAG TPA: glutamate--tRNA ligase [Solirubrobacteraceae bacterium]|nr:glutamate--tRNA ligase [Solirubrobacteraceae bacterium]
MRVRFAPSPTGALHIGGARTALFNWLLARSSGGALVLRIEDTDRERSTPENVEQILDALRWLELDWDEGPIFQTQRSGRHQEVLRQLLASGHAYHSDATAQDVKQYKERHGADRGFRGAERAQDAAPADGEAPAGQAGDEAPAAVRLRVPDEGATVVHDVIRGETRFEHIHLDDPVIARSDGSVLYNFAVAVDDLDAGITHVVRGEDHLSNTPKQLLVLEALGAPQPLYAHLPLLHGPDGKKLSKRHGAASVQELRAAGYLPAAVRNYLALLGWGSGDDATVMSTQELIERFSLERVSRNPAQFDEAKLRWLNGLYIRALPVAELAERVAEYLAAEGPPLARDAGVVLDPDRLARAAAISQEKMQVLAEFWPLAGFLFAVPEGYDEKARARWLGDDGRAALAETRCALAAAASFDEAGVQAALDGLQERLGVKPREIYQPLRVALTGTAISPGIFESVALLGREETLRRIDAALGAHSGETRLKGAHMRPNT